MAKIDCIKLVMSDLHSLLVNGRYVSHETKGPSACGSLYLDDFIGFE